MQYRVVGAVSSIFFFLAGASQPRWSHHLSDFNLTVHQNCMTLQTRLLHSAGYLERMGRPHRAYVTPEELCEGIKRIKEFIREQSSLYKGVTFPLDVARMPVPTDKSGAALDTVDRYKQSLVYLRQYRAACEALKKKNEFFSTWNAVVESLDNAYALYYNILCTFPDILREVLNPPVIIIHRPSPASLGDECSDSNDELSEDDDEYVSSSEKNDDDEWTY